MSLQLAAQWTHVPVSVVSVSLCFVEAIVASPEEEDDHLKRFFIHNLNVQSLKLILSPWVVEIHVSMYADSQSQHKNSKLHGFQLLLCFRVTS